MPKRKYATTAEILQYIDLLCNMYGLHGRAIFQTKVTSLIWNAGSQRWDAELVLQPRGHQTSKLSVHADYAFHFGGFLNNPHLSQIPGFDSFAGPHFHTSRWNYGYTGGTYQNPEMTTLSDKRVAIIGTGATGIQIIPEVAKYAKELFVYQRTPSAVMAKDDGPIDPKVWKEQIAKESGWQQKRVTNFDAQLSDEPGSSEHDLIDDAW